MLAWRPGGGVSFTSAGRVAAADLDLHCLSPSLEDVHYKAGASEGDGCKMERDALKPGTPEIMVITPGGAAAGAAGGWGVSRRWVLSVHNFGGELKGTASIAESRAVVRVYTAAGLVAEFDARAAAVPPALAPAAAVGAGAAAKNENENANALENGHSGNTSSDSAAVAVERLGSRSAFAWWHVAAVHTSEDGVLVVAPIMELSSHTPTTWYSEKVVKTLY